MSDKDEALLGSVLAPGGIVMVDIETTGKLCAMLRSQHARIKELEQETAAMRNGLKSRDDQVERSRHRVAELEAVARVALEALEGSVKIIARVDKGITTLERQEADPHSGLNDSRAAIESLRKTLGEA